MSQFVPNTIAHFDICGPDAAALTEFYGSLFGWVASPKGPGYSLLGTPEGSPNGAIVEAQTSAFTVGIVVADIDGVVDAAAGRGGEVVMAVTDNGWVKKAMLRDPAGNIVTVIQG